MFWRGIVRCLGGFYAFGPYSVLVHDAGIHCAKHQVTVWQWGKATKPRKSRAEIAADEDRLTRYR